jgi:hypothetical protein
MALELLSMVSSGMLRRVALTRATQPNIPEDTILHSHRHENLKSYTWAIGRFRYFVVFQREYSVLLSWVSSLRNLLIDDCLIVLISLNNCWLTLFRRFLSCVFLDWCHFLLSLHFFGYEVSNFFKEVKTFCIQIYQFILFIYCIQADPVTGLDTSSQTMDIECVKYKKIKEIKTNVPSIVGTSQKKHKKYMTQSLHN